MDTKGGKPRWGGDGGVLNWAIGINMCTLTCIKLMTNKNLLYKKINKIKFKNKIKIKKNKPRILTPVLLRWGMVEGVKAVKPIVRDCINEINVLPFFFILPILV